MKEKTCSRYKYALKKTSKEKKSERMCCVSAGGQAEVSMPGFSLFLETGLLLVPLLRREPAFHATHKNKQRFPGTERPSALCGAPSAPDGRRQTLGRHPSHTNTHTRSPFHTQVGNPVTELTVGQYAADAADGAILVSL